MREPGPCQDRKDGRCVRFAIPAHAGWCLLCQTKLAYRTAWEEGRGPGQSRPEADGQVPRPPPVRKQAWNLAKSLAAFVADRMRLVSKGEYRARLEICSECVPPDGFRVGNSCRKCGCNLALKARGRAFVCPESKWPDPRR